MKTGPEFDTRSGKIRRPSIPRPVSRPHPPAQPTLRASTSLRNTRIHEDEARELISSPRRHDYRRPRQPTVSTRPSTPPTRTTYSPAHIRHTDISHTSGKSLWPLVCRRSTQTKGAALTPVPDRRTIALIPSAVPRPSAVTLYSENLKNQPPHPKPRTHHCLESLFDAP